MSKKRRKKAPFEKKEETTSFEKRVAKKATVLGTKKKSRLPFIAILICVALIAGGAVFYKTSSNKNKPVVTAEAPVIVQPSLTQPPTMITYPESLFMDGVAKHFQYQHDDITIKYFILKSSDGVIRAAFDACDVCWPAGKGYYQDGDHMVCRNCGRKFASILVNEVKGGCNPAPLNRSVQDQQVVIQVKDLLEGRQYFDFSQVKPKRLS